MAILNRDKLIKSSQKLKKVSLEAGDIFIRLLSAHEIFEMKKKNEGREPSEEMLYELASMCITGADGSQMLSKEDVPLLDMETINKIIIEIYEFNNLNPDAVNKAKEALKNQTAPIDSITS